MSSRFEQMDLRYPEKSIVAFSLKKGSGGSGSPDPPLWRIAARLIL
jgi:hypothetical protein